MGVAPSEPFKADAQHRSKVIRPTGTLIISGGTVIDGTGNAPLDRAVVVIRDGVIEFVGDASDATALHDQHTTLDVSGKYLIPGLIDLHVHFTGDQVEIAVEDRVQIEMQPTQHRKYMEPVHAVRVLRGLCNARAVFDAGFTTVRNLGHGDPAQIAAVRDAIRDGLSEGPNILSAGWAISQTGGHGKLPIWPYELTEDLRPRSSFADGPEQLANRTLENIENGAECIKIYTTEGVIDAPDRMEGIPNFTVDEIRAVTETAHAAGVRVAAHATSVEGAMNAVLGGVDTIEHGPHVVDRPLIELMVQSGAILVPTLSVFDFSPRGKQDHVFPQWVAERSGRWLEGSKAFVAAAHAAGVRVAVGSDSGAPPRGGKNAHELELLVQAGLTPTEAIGAATTVGAMAIGRGDEVGAIRPGLAADILVVRDNPLSNISSLLKASNIVNIVQSQPQGMQ